MLHILWKFKVTDYFFDIERDDAGNSLLNFKQTNNTASLHLHAVLKIFYILFCLSLTALLMNIIERCYIIPVLPFYLDVLVEMILLKRAHVIFLAVILTCLGRGNIKWGIASIQIGL